MSSVVWTAIAGAKDNEHWWLLLLVLLLILAFRVRKLAGKLT